MKRKTVVLLVLAIVIPAGIGAGYFIYQAQQQNKIYIGAKPFNEQILFSVDSSVGEVIRKLKEEDQELALIKSDSKFHGYITLTELLKLQATENSIEYYLNKNKTYSPEDKLHDTIHEMKDMDRSLSIIVKNHKPVGILIPSDVLYYII